MKGKDSGASAEAGRAQIILGLLNQWQRDFILKMKPHDRDQRMSKADWHFVDPCVDLDPGEWPNTYWFGGMRAAWPAKRCRRTFRFNAVGLEVRAHLANPNETPQPPVHGEGL